MAAVHRASRSIGVGEVAVALAGGAENMSRVPYFLTDFRWGHRLGDVHLKDQLVIADPMTGKPRAVQAGEEGVEFGITREEQDRWAVRSNELYFKAKAACNFKDELMTIQVPQERGEPIAFADDESPRADVAIDMLAKLPTISALPTGP